MKKYPTVRKSKVNVRKGMSRAGSVIAAEDIQSAVEVENVAVFDAQQVQQNPPVNSQLVYQNFNSPLLQSPALVIQSEQSPNLNNLNISSQVALDENTWQEVPLEQNFAQNNAEIYSPIQQQLHNETFTEIANESNQQEYSVQQEGLNQNETFVNEEHHLNYSEQPPLNSNTWQYDTTLNSQVETNLSGQIYANEMIQNNENTTENVQWSEFNQTHSPQIGHRQESVQNVEFNYQQDGANVSNGANYVDNQLNDGNALQYEFANVNFIGQDGFGLDSQGQYSEQQPQPILSGQAKVNGMNSADIQWQGQGHAPDAANAVTPQWENSNVIHETATDSSWQQVEFVEGERDINYNEQVQHNNTYEQVQTGNYNNYSPGYAQPQHEFYVQEHAVSLNSNENWQNQYSQQDTQYQGETQMYANQQEIYENEEIIQGNTEIGGALGLENIQQEQVQEYLDYNVMQFYDEQGNIYYYYVDEQGNAFGDPLDPALFEQAEVVYGQDMQAFEGQGIVMEGKLVEGQIQYQDQIQYQEPFSANELPFDALSINDANVAAESQAAKPFNEKKNVASIEVQTGDDLDDGLYGEYKGIEHIDKKLSMNYNPSEFSEETVLNQPLIFNEDTTARQKFEQVNIRRMKGIPIVTFGFGKMFFSIPRQRRKRKKFSAEMNVRKLNFNFTNLTKLNPNDVCAYLDTLKENYSVSLGQCKIQSEIEAEERLKDYCLLLELLKMYVVGGGYEIADIIKLLNVTHDLNVYTMDTQQLNSIQSLVLNKKYEEALALAMSCNLWSHALILSLHLNKFNETIVSYSSQLGSLGLVYTSLFNLQSHQPLSINIDSSELSYNWKQILLGFLHSNNEQDIEQLGDRLFYEWNRIEAAQFCYLLKLNEYTLTDSIKSKVEFVLHSDFVTSSQLTILLEQILKKSNFSPNCTKHKIYFIFHLLDFGLIEEAKEFIAEMGEVDHYYLQVARQMLLLESIDVVGLEGSVAVITAKPIEAVAPAPVQFMAVSPAIPSMIPLMAAINQGDSIAGTPDLVPVFDANLESSDVSATPPASRKLPQVSLNDNTLQPFVSNAKKASSPLASNEIRAEQSNQENSVEENQDGSDSTIRSIFSSLNPFRKAKVEASSKQAKLGEKSSFVYDKEKNKWVNLNAHGTKEEAPLAPPPKITSFVPSVATDDSVDIGSVCSSAPTPSIADSGPALLTVPTTGSVRKKKSVRDRYVEYSG